MQKKSKNKTPRNGASRRVLLWGGVAALLAVAVWLVMPSGKQGARLDRPASASDYMRGYPEAKAVLVVYSDFQCSACRTYKPLFAQLKKEFGDDLAVVFRFFPLRQAFAHADLSARVAEAAGRQGLFWPMHDLLYDKQPEWAKAADTRALFMQYAAGLGLEMQVFMADLENPAVAERIELDHQSGLASGVRGTPALFLNNAPLENIRSYADLQAAVQKAIDAR